MKMIFLIEVYKAEIELTLIAKVRLYGEQHTGETECIWMLILQGVNERTVRK